MAEIYDHTGAPVKHGRARVNGIRMHYVTAGQGPALLLLHGTPKTHFYWYKLIPLLTPHFTVVAPDLRGFGDTDKAKKLLKEALALDPQGLDANYFYADFLHDQGDDASAKLFAQKALHAAHDPARPAWDAGRRREIQALIAKLR